MSPHPADPAAAAAPSSGRLRWPAALGLAVAFLGVHAALALLDVLDVLHHPAGDVTEVYRFWVDRWQRTGVLVGVDTAWVYPIGALVPILLAAVPGLDPYLWTWLAMVTVLDAVATVLLARRRPAAAWWWIAFTALLGPVALSRLDGVALPLAVVGVLAIARRPWAASVLLTAAAWVKVWPAALVAALLLSGRRLVPTAAAALGTSAVVVTAGVAVGAGRHLFSFVSAQTGRGLQIEAPAALPWLWAAAGGDPRVSLYTDPDLLTRQVGGAGVGVAAAVLTWVLPLGVGLVVVLAAVARSRSADPGVLLAVTALGLVSALIALNKVGSPQYLTWYAAPVILGLLVAPDRFRPVAAAVLLMAGLTQVVFPWWYLDLITARPWAVAVLTLRNALEAGLLVWCLLVLASLARRAPAVRIARGAVAATPG